MVGIDVKWTLNGQVKDLENHYGDLIDYCRKRLKKNRGLILRDLDRELFIKPTPTRNQIESAIKRFGKTTPTTKQIHAANASD